jgi:class 3 adenylate cyclase
VKVCGSCGTENPDAARFCATCGSSLVGGCPVCGAEVPDGARFCPSCGSAIADAEILPSGQERRLVTILFADVTGSTGLGEQLDPERLQEVMGTYFRAMREEIEAEGGTVEKFIGDAVMAAFGVPTAHEDDPRRALRAALRMRRRLAGVNAELDGRFGVTLQIRTGVNTGEVLAATSPRPGEPMVTGDTVNVAARLEQTAEPGQVVVAERTARAARGFRFRELGERDLRGKTQPVPAVVLEEEAPAWAERGVPGLRAPMVGRDSELEVLRSLYQRSANEGRPNLVTIYGDPGVGKSRLTAEFLAWSSAAASPPVIVRGRCLPYGDGVTYWPLAEILKERSGVLDTDAPEVALERIRAMGRELLTEDVAADPAKATAALAYTVGVDDPVVSFSSLEPREVRLKTHGAWRSFFSALANASPVLAVIEDIHWADPALLDLLEELAERVQGPVVFVCTARPELTERRPGWGGGRRNFSSVALDPLTSQEADELVTLLLTIDELPETVHRHILERAEGNPFFLEEIIRKLIDEGRIVRDGERWRAAAGIDDVVVPDTVQAVLAARIDLLGPKEKRALQSAAVVGRIFWPGPVLLLLNGEGPELDDTLASLEDRDLVLSRLGSAVAGQREFAFKHVLTRDVAYESLPRRDRARAHSAVAGWIESTAGERRGEFAELLAYHYEEAYRGRRDDAGGDPDSEERLRSKAFDSLMRASEDARRRFALAKAAAMAERARTLAAGPVERAVALEQIGMVALNDYRGDLAYASFAGAADLRAEHALTDRMAIARVCARAAEIPMRWPGSMKRLPPEEDVQRFLELGLANVGDRDSEERARLLLARGFIAYAFGRRRTITDEEYRRARAEADEATDIALRLGRNDLASAGLDSAGATLWPRGLYGHSFPIVRRRLELAESLEDPWELGDIHATSAWAMALMGDLPQAAALATKGAALSESEAQGMALHNLSWLAYAEFYLGNWSAVVDEILPRVLGLLGERSEDPPYFTAHAFGSAAFVHDARGDPSAAELIALLRRHASAETGEWPASSLIWLASVLARQGRSEEVEELFEKLLSRASGTLRPLEDQVRAEVLARFERWELVPSFLERSRTFAESGELRAVPVHLHRLEGRSAIATGEVQRGLASLERAREGFLDLGAAWERARTELDIADALADLGRGNDARARLDEASRDLERAGALIELERLKELRSRVG